jgi:hypothetical protein
MERATGELPHNQLDEGAGSLPVDDDPAMQLRTKATIMVRRQEKQCSGTMAASLVNRVTARCHQG